FDSSSRRSAVFRFGNLSVNVTGTGDKRSRVHLTHGPPAPEHRSTTLALPDLTIAFSNRGRIGSYLPNGSFDTCRKSVKPLRTTFGHQAQSWISNRCRRGIHIPSSEWPPNLLYRKS